jgi:hypothetical protein
VRLPRAGLLHVRRSADTAPPCPAGSFHVLSPGLLPFNEEHHLLDGEETELMNKLEKASGGRGVMLIRQEPKTDQFLLLARDREVAQVSHVYFLHKELRMWLFARNRSKTGFNPNAISAGGVNDVGDVKQRVITYLMEIPFLYSVMIGSFLLLFVPQCVLPAPASRLHCAR